MTKQILFLLVFLLQAHGAAFEENEIKPVDISTTEWYGSIHLMYNKMDFSKPDIKTHFTAWLLDLLTLRVEIKNHKNSWFGLPLTHDTPVIESLIVTKGQTQTIGSFILSSDPKTLKEIGLYFLNKCFFDAILISFYDSAHPVTPKKDMIMDIASYGINYGINFNRLKSELIKSKTTVWTYLQDHHIRLPETVIKNTPPFRLVGNSDYEHRKTIMTHLKTIAHEHKLTVPSKINSQIRFKKAGQDQALIQKIRKVCQENTALHDQLQEITWRKIGAIKGLGLILEDKSHKKNMLNFTLLQARLAIEKQQSEAVAQELLALTKPVKKKAPTKKKPLAKATPKPSPKPDLEKLRLEEERKERQRQADRERSAQQLAEKHRREAQRAADRKRAKEAKKPIAILKREPTPPLPPTMTTTLEDTGEEVQEIITQPQPAYFVCYQPVYVPVIDPATLAHIQRLEEERLQLLRNNNLLAEAVIKLKHPQS